MDKPDRKEEEEPITPEVVDKRRFRAEDVAPADAPEETEQEARAKRPPEPTGQEQEPQPSAGRETAQAQETGPAATQEQAEAAPGGPAGEDEGKTPDIHSLLAFYLNTLRSYAWMWMGLMPNPQTKKVERDLDQARVAIDACAALAELLLVNLTEEERQELRRALNDLQLNFVNQSKGS